MGGRLLSGQEGSGDIVHVRAGSTVTTRRTTAGLTRSVIAPTPYQRRELPVSRKSVGSHGRLLNSRSTSTTSFPPGTARLDRNLGDATDAVLVVHWPAHPTIPKPGRAIEWLWW
jgi:hypothetical protein